MQACSASARVLQATEAAMWLELRKRSVLCTPGSPREDTESYTRPVPPPPTPTSQGHLWLRVFWGPGGGMWSSWHVPEATYCALASRSCPGLSGTSRVGNAGLAAVEDSPRLQDPPDPGSPPPSSANLDPRSPREEALGASSIAAASAPGAPDSSPSRPCWQSNVSAF